MPNIKRPSPPSAALTQEEKDDALVQQLCDLAVESYEASAQADDDADDDKAGADAADGEAAAVSPSAQLLKIIRKCLNRKQDDILYEAIERSKYADLDVWQRLKEQIEEAAAVTVIRREQGPAHEINAFIIPVFARTVGGLHDDQCCTDQEAFDLLGKSVQQAQLESADARVVLVNHAYCLDEIDSITYSHLSDMLRDAYTSLTDKKPGPTPAIDRSFGGWPENLFAPGDEAIELRFLLGFALKNADDPFYVMPEEDAEIDDWFDARAVRFQQWAEISAPLVKRLLRNDGGPIDINFLYQDLFFGGKERGIAEYFMLQMMSSINQSLESAAVDAADVQAVVAPVALAYDTVLRVNLYRGDPAATAPFATAERPLDPARGLPLEIEDSCDALRTIGIASLAVADGYDAQGQAQGARPA